LLVILRRIH